MTERDNMRVISGQGLANWRPDDEKQAREVFEAAMRTSEQVFVIGIRRKPDSPWNTDSEYVHVNRLSRTCFFEFVGAMHEALRALQKDYEEGE